MQQNMQDKMPVPPLPALFNHGVKQEVTTMDERVTGRVEEFDEARNSKYWGGVIFTDKSIHSKEPLIILNSISEREK